MALWASPTEQVHSTEKGSQDTYTADNVEVNLKDHVLTEDVC